ncbi:MAG: hypothetical protein WC141_05185 [Arcobacteraceae bacterium]
MSKKITVSSRLNETEIAIINSVATTRKISKSEAISYIIRAYSTSQNQSVFLSISDEINETKNELNQSLFLVRSMLNNVQIETKITKFLTLYDFAERTNKETAKSYLEAAEKRAISEIKS